MLHLLRILFLILVGCILAGAIVRISSGSTGIVEKFAFAVAAFLWILAAWRELRELRLGTLSRNSH
jgi:hypothetical protein